MKLVITKPIKIMIMITVVKMIAMTGMARAIAIIKVIMTTEW